MYCKCGHYYAHINEASCCGLAPAVPLAPDFVTIARQHWVGGCVTDECGVFFDPDNEYRAIFGLGDWSQWHKMTRPSEMCSSALAMHRLWLLFGPAPASENMIYYGNICYDKVNWSISVCDKSGAAAVYFWEWKGSLNVATGGRADDHVRQLFEFVVRRPAPPLKPVDLAIVAFDGVRVDYFEQDYNIQITREWDVRDEIKPSERMRRLDVWCTSAVGLPRPPPPPPNSNDGSQKIPPEFVHCHVFFGGGGGGGTVLGDFVSPHHILYRLMVLFETQPFTEFGSNLPPGVQWAFFLSTKIAREYEFSSDENKERPVDTIAIGGVAPSGDVAVFEVLPTDDANVRGRGTRSAILDRLVARLVSCVVRPHCPIWYGRTVAGTEA